MAVTRQIISTGKTLVLPLVLLSALSLGSSAWAQTDRLWDDGQNNNDNWGTSNNWNPNNRPTSTSERAVFATNGLNTTSIEVNNNYSVGGLIFQSSLTDTLGFYNSGRTLTVDQYGIINQSATTVTFDNKFKLNKNQTWEASHGAGGGLVFNQALNLNSRDLTFNTANVSNSITIDGLISNNNGDLTKTGDGVLSLTNASNSFKGSITVNDGTLSISSEGALGSSSATNSLILDGGTLRTEGSSVNIGSTDRSIVLGSSGGTIETVTNLTLSKTLSGSGALIKTGAGSLTLTEGNTFTGGTTVNNGTLLLATGGGTGVIRGDLTVNAGATVEATATDAFGYNGGAKVTNVTVNGGTIVNSIGSGNGNLGWANTFTLSNGATLSSNSGVSSDSAVSNFTLNADSSINATAGTSTIEGRMNLRGDSGLNVDMTVANGATLEVTAAITSSGGDTGFTKLGTGTLALSGSNTFSGNVTVGAGTLAISHANALGSGGSTTVNSGGTLALSNNITVATETGGLSLNGTGYNGGGALQNTSGNNLWDGNITLAGHATIQSLAGQLKLGDESSFTDTISLGSNTLTFDTSGGNLWVNAIISGTGSVVKSGSGTLTYYMDENTYTGTTTVKDGTLLLDTLVSNANPNAGIRGNIVVGDSTGAAQSAIFQHSTVASQLIADSANLTVYSDGLYNLNNQVDTIGSLTLQGGAVSLGVGVLTLSGNLTSLASSQTATITSGSEDGSLSFGNATRVISVADGAAASDLTLSAQLVEGGFTKTGTGTLTLAPSAGNDNSYTGTTTISQGIVNIQSNSALGSADNLAGSGTTVNAGAQLQVQGNIAVGAERLVLNGTGVSGTGALRNLSGTNSWAGSVVVNSHARVQNDAGTLTFNGTITGGGTTLTVAGAGQTNITNTTTLNSVVKEGSGTLTVSGTQNYVTASINGGNYVVGASNILNDGMTATIASGATMKVNGQTDTIAAIAGAGTLEIASGGHLTVGAGNTAVTFSGHLTGDGTGTFEKIGTGTLTFNASFDFDGDITFAGGTLQLANVTIGANTLHITGDSIIDFGGSSILSVEHLIIDAGVNISIINWADTVDYFYASNWAGATYDTRFNTPTTQVVFDGGSPAWTGDNTIWQSYDNQITPVPEPRTYGLLFMGLSLGALALRRRNRSPTA